MKQPETYLAEIKIITVDQWQFMGAIFFKPLVNGETMMHGVKDSV
jgi:hypothetical protein